MSRIVESKPKIHQLWNLRLPCARFGDIALAEVVVSRHISAAHAHPGFSLVWTCTGWDFFSCPEFNGAVPANSLVAIAAGAIHQDRAGFLAPAHSLAVYFPPGYPGVHALNPSLPIFESSKTAGLMRKVARSARKGLELDVVLAELVLELTKHFSGQAPLDSIPMEPPRGKSRSANLRAFSRAVGCTPGQFERQQRVRAAAARLLQGESAADAAAAAGFCDQSHMHRHFIQVFGVTPSEFVKRNSVQDGGRLEV